MVNYVVRPYEEALLNIIERAIDPNNGRIVTAPMAALGRILTQESVLQLADELQSNSNFQVRAVDNMGNRGRPASMDELRRRPAEDLDDLRLRAQRFVDAFFAAYASEIPALTEKLRWRILAEYARTEGE